MILKITCTDTKQTTKSVPQYISAFISLLKSLYAFLRFLQKVIVKNYEK